MYMVEPVGVALDAAGFSVVLVGRVLKAPRRGLQD
jgi:hypothetical protein